MSSDRDHERWLTFEVGTAAYALPIAGVLEVVEAATSTGIPSLPREQASVINWHGDALPVLAAKPLLNDDGDEHPPASQDEDESEADAEAAAPAGPVQILVISSPSAATARFGLPVDTVLGLVDRGPARTRAGAVVTERASIGGRVVGMLDPSQLVARAGEVVEQLIAW